jgi:RHS repeat-associated protein
VTEPSQDPVLTNYLHDGIHVIAEYNGEGELLKEYVYSDNIDEVLNIKDGTENFFPHQDGLNSVVAVTDADGERIASYNYEAFGTIKDATGALGNPITYTGRWIEPETGDYFYRARYYDAGIGRFLKRDPIGFGSKDYNFYRYVGNNSQNYTDPFGNKWYTVKKCTIAIFYGHSNMQKLRDIEVEESAGTTSVGCESNIVHEELQGLIPGAIGTDKNSAWAPKSVLRRNNFASNKELYRANLNAARIYARNVLCCPPHNCKKVKIIPKKVYMPFTWKNKYRWLLEYFRMPTYPEETIICPKRK